MKRDIRDLFKSQEETNDIQLPENHRAEFLERLENQSKPNKKLSAWLSVAAVLLIALTIGFRINNPEPEEEKISPIVAQVEAIESEYLTDIENEWQNFIAIATDDALIERFRKKLKELDTGYQDISVQFKEDSNNILVIEALVENLQTRLQILKDIQKHIKILNQNNDYYENTI